MHPVLIEIGGFAIYTYGLFIALAVAVCATLATNECRRLDIPENIVYGFVFLVILAGVLGGRFGYVLTYWFYYRHNWSEIILLRRGGLSFIGALSAALAAGVYYLLYRRAPVLKVLDAFFLYLPLGLGIGRFGCFFNGCCYGYPTNRPWGVKFPLLEVPVHPTQLYHAAAGLVVFVFLRLAFRKGLAQNPGRVTGWFLVLYGMERFVVDRFRGEMTTGLLNLYVTQRWAVLLVLLGSGMLLFRRQGGEPCP